jgi:hypothetical protein
MNILINQSPAFLRTRLYRVRQLFLGNYIVASVAMPEEETREETQRYPQVVIQAKSQSSKLAKKIYNLILSLLVFASVIAGASIFGPKLYYSFFQVETVEVAAQTEGTPLGGDFDLEDQDNPVLEPTQKPAFIPPKNKNLPEGDWLVIPRIGVRSLLQATENSKDALATGLWLAPDYGKAGETDLPMIVAGHRYGWKWWWKDDYWRYHSFYLLPDLEPGDIVEVISDQRKWIYEIYAGEEGQEITDYKADLIIYTCKFLNSSIRHFRYARLIDPTANTQK